MILSHGTSTSNAELIVKEGAITPRKDKGNWFRESHQPSIDNFVYFANTELDAVFHATRTAIYTGTDCAILNVNVDDNKLYPDENFFNEKGIVDKLDMIEMQTKALMNKDKWKESLIKQGLVCHMGPVPVEHVVELREFPITKSIYYGFVKRFENIDIDAFDKAFNIFLQVQHTDWFKSNTDGMEFEEIVSSFEVEPDTDNSFYAHFKGDSIRVVFG